MESYNKILPPNFSKRDIETLKKYFELNKKYQQKINDELMPALMEDPLWGPMIKNQTPEARKVQEEQSIERQRAAIYDDKWDEYTQELMTQGVVYARMNIPYGDWYKIIKMYKDHLIPHIKKDFVNRTEEALTFIDGLDKLVDYAMYGIAEAYFTEKNNIIKAKEENFRAIFENSTDHILLIDKEANIITLNYAAPGLNKEELIGKNLFNYQNTGNGEIAVRSAIDNVLKNRKSCVFESSYYSEDEAKFFSSSISPIFSENGEVNSLVFISRDITDKKKSEEKIMDMNLVLEKKIDQRTEELKKSNDELEQFAYVASHDLQEPLRTITNFVGLFEKQYKGKFDKEAETYLNFIASSAKRMQVLIKDLLEYSRIGKIDKGKVKINCNKLLDEVLKDMSNAVNESKAEIQIGHLPVIKAYAADMKSLFQNLISNSIKFQTKGVTPLINISSEDKKAEWLFAIKDNGIGIEEKYYSKLFILFQRLHNKSEYPGTGIGLVQCRKIVELHGGKIWVESQLDKGTTFYFTIPKTK